MKSITEQVDDIKSEVCDSLCKWLERANKTHFETLEDLEKLQQTMQEICAKCPLRRL